MTALRFFYDSDRQESQQDAALGPLLVEISAGKSAEKKASVHKNMEPEDYEDDSEFPLDMQCKIGVKKVSGKFTDFYNFHESAIKVY